MDAQRISAERRRAVALLAPERTGVPLRAGTPNPPPEALGALTAMSWDTDAPAVRVIAYLFADGEQAHRVGTALVEMIDGGVYYARALASGGWLLLVITRTDQPRRAEGCARVDHLVRAFSGLE